MPSLNRFRPQPGDPSPPTPGTPNDQADARLMALVAEPPRRKLGDLILPDEVVDAIRHAADTLRVADTLMAWLGEHEHRIAVSFYGPPGTGKTSAADALADLLGMPVMRVNYADLESRFVGDTPKNVRHAFRQAEAAGALLFFDEADSILAGRFTQPAHANDAFVNQTRSTMMLELDHFRGAVVFATNLQENYDDAFVRRIAAHIRFPLPDLPLRVRLWRKYLPPTLPQADDVSPERLAALTERFSPADIAAAVRQAAVSAAVRTDDQRRVFARDLEAAMARIKQAKYEVGRQRTWTATRETTREVSPAEVPEAFRAPEEGSAHG